jgi:hypothetical protein
MSNIQYLGLCASYIGTSVDPVFGVYLYQNQLLLGEVFSSVSYRINFIPETCTIYDISQPRKHEYADDKEHAMLKIGSTCSGVICW